MKRRTHQIQVSLRLEKPRNVIVTKEFLNAALHYRAATGEDLPGVEIKAIVWLVNDRENKYDGDADITEVLNKMFRMGLKPRFQALGKSKRMERSSRDDG